MMRLGNANAVEQWLDRLQIARLIVISPHLDDAVFSLAGLLGVVRDRAEVVTVFTEGSESQNDWARRSGFADSIEEHKTRRQEDSLAMNRLGCGFRHLGLSSGGLNAASATHALNTLAQAHPDGFERSLVLIPAGAGGPPPASPLSRFMQRLQRRPSGSQPHGEHEQTRDIFWQALCGWPARRGFYAEIPYAWSHNSNNDLSQRLARDSDCKTDVVTYRHDTAKKLPLVELYQSQKAPIFGTDPAYLRRVMEREESLFVEQP